MKIILLLFLCFLKMPSFASEANCNHLISSFFKNNDQEALRLIYDLRAVNGNSSFIASPDGFWVDLNNMIHPKANFTEIPEKRRLWKIKSEKANELSEFFPQLTLAEIVAVRSYASNSGALNIALYDLNLEKIKYYKNYINVLSSALSKLEQYEGMVYRTQKLSHEYAMAKYVKGKIVTETGFISTSHTSFWNHANYTNETIRFFIKSKTGRLIKELSEHKKEREVLFNIVTQFKVIKAQMNNEDRHCFSCFDVILEEI